MRIANKQESHAFIRSNNINTVPEKILRKQERQQILDFFIENIADLYIIRDGSRTSSKYFYIRNYTECLEHIDEFDDMIIIAVSIKGFRNQLLLGTVQFMSNNDVNIICTTNQSLDHRTIYLDGEFDYTTNIFDKKLNKIPCFDTIYAYVHKYDLYDHIVEFTIYDRKVGTIGDFVVINEVRDY